MIDNLKQIVSILEEYKIRDFKIYTMPMFLEIFLEVKYKWQDILMKIYYDRDIKMLRELLNYYNK